MRSLNRIFLIISILIGLLAGVVPAAIAPVEANTKIFLSDVNNDGKLDIVVSNIDKCEVYLNSGTASQPQFGSPIYSAPLISTFDAVSGTLADIDYDGDQDLFIGTSMGTIEYIKNTGTASNPAWSQVVNTGSYTSSYNGVIYAGMIQQLSFADIDGDGDQDMIFNNSGGDLTYYLNQDKESDGWVDGRGVSWVKIPDRQRPITIIAGDAAKHQWTDFDGDGDLDLVAGRYPYGIAYARNIGSAQQPIFATSANILTDVVTGYYASVFFEDFNNDGFLDLYYTTMTGAFNMVSAVTRQSANDVDDAPPLLAQNALSVEGIQMNAVTLRWPYIYDNATSSYRSGVKYYELYRSVDDPDFTNPYRLWRHYQQAHAPDYVPEFGTAAAAGDKFKIEDGANGYCFYYQDASLPGGHTYYYKLRVVDYAGNSVETDPVSQELANPQFSSVRLDLTPTISDNSFVMTITTLDQYGMEFPVNTEPSSGGPNVAFTVYENNTPSSVALVDDVQADLADTALDGISSRSFTVTYRPNQPCVTFTVQAEVTHWIDASTPVVQTGVSDPVTIDREAPPLPTNLAIQQAEITLNSITVRWDAVNDSCSGVARYHVYGRLEGAPSYTQLGTTSNHYYVQSNLTQNSTHYYYVVAEDNAGNMLTVTDPDSIAISGTTLADITPPSTPTGVSARYNSTETQITVSWNASTDDFSGVAQYEIQKKDGDNAFFNTAAMVAAPSVSWVDPTPYPGYPIYYQVRAYDGYNNVSDWSVIAVADSTADSVAPSTPTNLQASASGPTSVQLTWNPSSDTGSGVKSYRVYRNGSTSPVGEVTSTSYSDTSLTAFTLYSYQVSAVDNAGNESGKSGSVSIMTEQDPTSSAPGIPRNLQVTGRTSTSISLSWSAPLDNGTPVSYYRIYRHPSATSPQSSAVVVANQSTPLITVGNLEPNTTYYFSVSSISSYQVESDQTSRVSGITDVIKPSQPQDLTAVHIYGTSVDLQWSASTPPPGLTITSYRVYSVTPDLFGLRYVNVGTSATTQTTVTGLDPETDYRLVVAAYDNTGQRSAYSDELQVTTLMDDLVAPSKPANLTATAVDTSSIRLQWSASTDNSGGSGLDGYKVYRDGALLTTSTATTFVDDGLQPLTNYTYTVSAVDKTGNESAQSSPVTAQTLGLTDDLLCAHVASSDLWMTRFSILNTGTEDHPVYFYAIDADGTVVDQATLDSLPAQSTYSVDAADVFSPETFNHDIWVRISSESQLKGVLTFGTRDDQTMVTIPMFTNGAPDLIFPYVFSSDLWYTGITLINTGAETVTPTLYAFTDKGVYLTSKVVSVPAGGKYVRLVNEIFNYDDPSKIRFVQVESDNPLIGFELFGSFSDLGLAGLPAFSPTTDLFKSRLKADKLTGPSTPTGFQGTAVSSSEIYLSWNPNPESNIDHYAIYNNDGPFPSLVAETDQTHYTVSGLTAETAYRYSLKAVDTDSNESESTGIITITTLVDGQQDDPYLLYYNEIPDPSYYFIGITVSNLGEATTDVNMTLYDKDGVVVGEATRPVDPRQQLTSELDDFFDNQLPAGASYLKIGSTSKLMGFELFLTKNTQENPYQFDGVIAAPAGANLIYFPLVKADAEWSSIVKLTNVTATDNAFTLHAVDTNGTEIGTYADTLTANGKVDLDMADLFPDTMDQIAWIWVKADGQVVGDLLYMSSDMTRMSAYMGLTGVISK